MEDKKLTIERIIQHGEDGLTLYRLSDGEIINEDEAVNFVRQGRLQGVVVTRDQNGRHYIKPADNGVKQF